jgi:hypothetical protein
MYSAHLSFLFNFLASVKFVYFASPKAGHVTVNPY